MLHRRSCPKQSFRIGLSASIYEALTAALRNALPSHWTFTFFDGAEECDAAPGIGAIFSGPYYCHYSQFYTAYVAQAHEAILDIIEDEGDKIVCISCCRTDSSEGPFDGVLAFSQARDHLTLCAVLKELIR